MKKCPFCAEEIRDEAVKCRFCGEWLVKNDTVQDDAVTPLKEPEQQKGSNFVLSESTAVTAKEGPSTSAQKPDAILSKPIKEKVPWGWGWFLLLGFFGMGINRVKKTSFSNETAGYRWLIELLGIGLLLLVYFWLRNRSLRKKQYAKTWHVSFMSGFLSYLFVGAFVGLLLGLVQGIDNRAAATQFNSTMKEMGSTAIQWNQEEERLWERINQAPTTAQGIADSVNSLKAILDLNGKRRAMSDRYFAEFKYFYEYSKNAELISKVEEMKKLSYNGYDLKKRGIETLIEAWLTGDEKKEATGLELLGNVDTLREKQESLAKEIRTYYPNW